MSPKYLDVPDFAPPPSPPMPGDARAFDWLEQTPGFREGMERARQDFAAGRFAPFVHAVSREARPCSRCHHQFRHHAVTEDGYRCRACGCRRRFWR